MDPLTDRIARLSPAQLAQLMARLAAKREGDAPAIPRRPAGEPAPLSFSQRGLWFAERYEPGSAAYNALSVVRFDGELDVAALRHALEGVVERHEALRTVFGERDGEPVQTALAGVRAPLEVEELRGTTPEEAEAEVERRARLAARRPFDLASGPLLCALLLRTDERRHHLVLVMHHIAGDGWSRGILVREVCALYAARVRGEDAALPEPPLQFPDYAAWQRRRLEGPYLREQLDWWTERLHGAPAALELPTDRPRPPVQSTEGALHRFRVAAPTADALREVAREGEATLFMVLLAAFQVFLARYTGESDVVVGTPVANRGHAETEGVVGFFANMLALRVDLSGDPSFRAALARVREAALGAYAHEELPFERLVEELHPARDPCRPVVFQTVFVQDGSPPRPVRLPGVEMIPIDADPRTSPFELMLRMEEAGEGLRGALEYPTALFDPGTAARMAEHFATLLAGIAADPDAPLSRLPLLAAAERRRVLEEWNDTARGYPRGECVHDLFARQAARTPDAPALVHRGEATTYAELDRRSARLANHLRRLGVGPETRVGVCLERTPQLVVALLAVLRAGGAYVPLDPAYPRERLGWMQEDARVSLVLTSSRLADVLPADTRALALDAVRADVEAEPGRAPDAGALPENLSHVIFTSGSTGRPKGVMIRHSSTVVLLHWLRENVSDEERSASLFSTSINFDVSVAEIFGVLCWGGKLVLVENALELASVDEPVVHASMVPTAAAELLRTGGIPASVKTLNLGGEPLPNDLAQALYELPHVEKVGNLYGPTEDTTYSTYSVVRKGDSQVLVGRPVADTRALVLDAALSPVPIGVVGELYLAGEGLARGYASRPELTAERFLPDPFGPAGSRMYRVMDRVRWRPDGELEYFGRTDFQVKVRGFRIELGEIESALRALPGVGETVAVVREDVPGERRIVAYLVPAAGGEAPAGARLRDALRERLPEYMVPSAFVVMERLPLTPNGKLDRRALPAPGAAEGTATSAPRTPTEALLAGIWAEVLDVERVGTNEDFFELGGHSLLAARVASRVRAALGVELPLHALFEAPTVAGLAAHLDSARGAEPMPPIERVDRSGPLPLSFAQQRLWLLHQLEPATYNLCTGLRLRGELSAEALRGALGRIVARHEVLRTRFAEERGEPVQVVEPARGFVLPLVDLGPFAAEERESHVARYAAEEAARAFDLAEAPLMRATLLRLGEREHVLLVAMHHIASDGWSVGVLAGELRAHYEAELAGAEAALPPLALQYGDYAVWQRSRLTDDALARRTGFWRTRLAGAPAALDLPSDRPRPPVPSFAGDSFTVRVDPATASGLRAVARREDVTLFMALLAGFAAFLHRYTAQEDMVVGTPVAGRDHPALEPLIGCFINVLPLRMGVDGEGSFRGLLREARMAMLDAYPHGDLSFDQVVEAAGIPRETSRNPLVQVLFALQNTPSAPLSLPGIRAEPVETAGGTSRYDLSLYLSEEADGSLATLVEYATDLYDRDTVERWTAHFGRLLAALAADPGTAVRDAPMLDAAEEEQLLLGWNRTDVEIDAGATVPRLLAAQARRTPDAPALTAAGETLSYAELDRRANRLAHVLAARGAGPETRVGILLDRSAEMVVAMLAVLKAGAAYLPLDPAYPAERLRLMVEDAGAALVLTGAALRGGVPGGTCPVLVLEDAAAELAAAPDADPEAALHPGNAAYVIYTSGSTGRPKGVVVPHAGVVNFFAAMRERVGEAPGSWLATTSISFDISVLEILWTLTQGSRVVLHGARPRSAAPRPAPATRPMDFSLFYFASSAAAEGPGKYRLLMEGAKWADRSGFTAVWTPERHFHAFGGLYPNPALTSAALAAVTERVRLRAGSVVLPLHDPIRVAEDWSVVDNLSDGRVELSFASGWHANDFVLAPDGYADRRETMFARLEEVRRLWRGETVTRPNGKGEAVEVATLPRPLQPELPFWITAAGSPDTFRRAGLSGANLLTHLLGQSVEELADKVRVYREGRREAGLDPETGRVALMLHAFVGDDDAAVRAAVRGPFREYLRTSFDLVLQLAPGAGFDPAHLSADDVETMLDFAFERYYRTSGLMGTPEACVATVRRLRAVGVDEVACLVDFGVEEERVLASLEGLGRVMEEAARAPGLPADDLPLAERIREDGVTHLQCTPSLAGMLAADPEALRALGGVSCILLGGEALPQALAARLREALPARIVNMYGPTETTVWSATHEVAEVDGPVPIGQPVANTRVYVVDAGMRPVPAGVAGELLIGGSGVVRGYHARPDLTAERFVPDPFGAEPGERLYRTGDLARRRADGTLEFLGRIDQQVKVRGHRIEPGEIEAVVASHPAVGESVVIAQDDGTGERRLVAYFTPAAAAEPRPLTPAGTPGEREALLAGLERFALPDGTVVAHQHDFITRDLYQEIWERQVYLRHGISLEDGATVMDVGANIGMFTLFAHTRARGVRTLSFEPIPNTFGVLRANAALFGLDARVFNAGLAEVEGTAMFTFYPNSTGLSGRYADLERDREVTRSVIQAWLRDGDANGPLAEELAGHLTAEEVDAFLDERFRAEVFSCPIRTLSQVMREEGIERVDLLKVDVEKSEYDVLLGVEEEDWPRIRQLVLEVDTEELLDRVLGLLDRHGYAHLVDRHVTVREGGAGDPGEYVYMVYARRPGDGALLRDAHLLTRGVAPGAAELRRWVADRLPDYMVPSLFVALERLPLTPNGKVDRRALPAAGESRSARETEYAAPRNELEEAIAEVWREVLGVERVGVRDNFFELGGTSIRLAAVHHILSERIDRPVTVVDLFRYSTVGTLAEHLARAGAGGGAGQKVAEALDRAGRGRQAREHRRPAGTRGGSA